MNVKIFVLAICVEAIIYLLLYNFHGCTFNVNYGSKHKDSVLQKRRDKATWEVSWNIYTALVLEETALH